MGEVEHTLLEEYRYFEDVFARGGHVTTRFMDPLDALLGEVFQESFKSSDGTVSRIMQLAPESEGRLALQQLQARPMSQLLTHSITPDITSAEPGTFAHKTASYAWDALSTNPYYSEEQKRWMSRQVGRLVHKAFNFDAEKLGYKTDDLTLDPSFRYGRHNMPEEEAEFEAKVKMLRELETQEKGITRDMRRRRHDDVRRDSLRYFVTPDVQQYFTAEDDDIETEAQAAERERQRLAMAQTAVETNWDVQAVVDEDEL